MTFNQPTPEHIPTVVEVARVERVIRELRAEMTAAQLAGQAGEGSLALLAEIQARQKAVA